MWDAVLCILIIGGFFVLRAILATVFFYYLLPEGDRCPNCDAPTLRVQSRGWNLLMPKFRTSWCYQCGWHGLFARPAHTDVAIASSADQARRSSTLAARRVEPEPLRPVPAQLEEVVEVHEPKLSSSAIELAERVAAFAVDRPDARRGRLRRGIRPASARDVRRCSARVSPLRS